MLVDIHAHSERTPGVAFSAQAVLKKARQTGLDAVCFTDREATAHAADLIRLGAQEGVEVFVGLELSTDHGVLLGFAPKIDAFYLREQWRSLLSTGTPSAQAVIDLFEQIGGAVLAAYPYDMEIPWASGDRLFALKGLHGLECYVPRLPMMRNAMAIEAAQALNLPMAGGSDVKDRLDVVGQSATLLTTTVSNQQELVDALRNGSYWATAVNVDFGASDAVEEPQRRERRRSSSDRGGRSGDRGDRGDRGGDRGDRGGDRGGRGGDRGGRGGDRGERGDRGGDRGGRGERGDRGGRSRGGDRGGRGGDRGGRSGGGRSRGRG